MNTDTGEIPAHKSVQVVPPNHVIIMEHAIVELESAIVAQTGMGIVTAVIVLRGGVDLIVQLP